MTAYSQAQVVASRNAINTAKAYERASQNGLPAGVLLAQFEAAKRENDRVFGAGS